MSGWVSLILVREIGLSFGSHAENELCWWRMKKTQEKEEEDIFSSSFLSG